jgi:plasmid stabilization system protein ParE
MNRSIIWTPEAETTFHAQLSCLEQIWPEMSLRKFIDRVYEVINHIGTHPEMHPVYNEENQVRSCVISPYLILYYKAENEVIYLLTFWPIRQKAKKNDI